MTYPEICRYNHKICHKKDSEIKKLQEQLATLHEKAKGIEEVHALIKSDFNNCFNSKEMDVIQANAVKMWQVIKNLVEGK